MLALGRFPSEGETATADSSAPTSRQPSGGTTYHHQRDSLRAAIAITERLLIPGRRFQLQRRIALMSRDPANSRIPNSCSAT